MYSERPVLRPGFQKQEAALNCFVNHRGLLVMDILLEETEMTSRRYRGTVLARVVTAVQKQRADIHEVTRTVLLQDNVAINKNARVIIQYNYGGRCVTNLVPATLQP